MKERDELKQILELIGKYNLPLSPILEYAVKEKMEEFPEELVVAINNDERNEKGEISEEEYDNSFLPQSYDVKWFCLSALSSLKGLLDNRTYQILNDTLNGESRSAIASKHNLTQERIRQIVVKATKEAKELFVEQRTKLEKEIEYNAMLNVQLNLMREDIVGLKALLPKELLYKQKDDNENLSPELAKLLETPIEEINLSARVLNVLQYMKLKKFVDIPQIQNEKALLKVRNSGLKTVHDITCILEDFHLTFGMSYTEIVRALKTYDCHAAKKKWIIVGAKKEIKQYDKENKHGGDDISHDRSVKDSSNEIEENKSEATIVLTKDIIEAARTPNGGFTKSQLSAIGIGWPPPQDWIKEKVGSMITPTQLEGFNHIEYVENSSANSYKIKSSITYKDVASSSDDRKKMEAILQAMTHFYTPATPYDIARTISRTAWGSNLVREETVDTLLKRLPEVQYIKWGKYILRNRAISKEEQSASTTASIKKVANDSDDKRIGYTIRLFPSQLKGEIIRVRKDSKGIKKLVVKTTNGNIEEVDDLPYLYEVLKRN